GKRRAPAGVAQPVAGVRSEPADGDREGHEEQRPQDRRRRPPAQLGGLEIPPGELLQGPLMNELVVLLPLGLGLRHLLVVLGPSGDKGGRQKRAPPRRGAQQSRGARAENRKGL